MTALLTRPAPGIRTLNGLTWKPYRYNGTGEDTLTPELGDAFGDEPQPRDPDTPPCWCGGNMYGYRRHLATDRNPCQASRDDVNLYHRQRPRKRTKGIRVHWDAGGGPRCGRGNSLTGDREQVTCEFCAALLDGTHARRRTEAAA